jgi:hypothetical protein
MKNATVLARAALRLYKSEGGTIFEIDEALDFMEEEIEACEDEDVSDEDLIRSVASYMLEME